MSDSDWGFGESIKNIVQSAVDSHDFSKLNQTVNQVINSAAKQVQKSVNDSIAKQKKVNPRPMQKPIMQPAVQLFKKGAGSKASGILLTVFGSLLLGFSLVGWLGWFSLIAGLGGGLSVHLVNSFVAFPFIVGGGIMLGVGANKLGYCNRFVVYKNALRDRHYCDINTLSRFVNKTPKFVVKDLQKMIGYNWFLQGHLDRWGTSFMLTDEVYSQYEATLLHLEEQKRQEDLQAPEETIEVSSEIQTIMKEGKEYLRKIKESNDAIEGVEISEKISRMELLIERIFERVQESPDVVPDIQKLMDYYLPITVKLLDAYEQLDTQPIQVGHIQSSKKEIEETLDTLNVAFEKLLDGLFRDAAWDVSSDIAVLHTMLAQEGLTKSDF